MPKKGKRNEELERFYRLEDGQEEGEDDEIVLKELRKAGGDTESLGDSSSEDSSSDDDEETEDEDDPEEEEIFGLLDQKRDAEGLGESGIPRGEVSNRLAVVNLDWDNIRAVDLMAVFSSFLSQGSGGRIRKVSIYPSEFGRERMEREEMEGPPKEIFAPVQSDKKQDSTSFLGEEEEDDEGEEEDGDVEVDDEDEALSQSDSTDDASASAEDEQIKQQILKPSNGAEFNSAKLRRYQLERLRYYYAVITCSSASVAQAIYDAIDGTEYLTTANFFDLRYIPDDTDFSDDKPRDECETIPDGYKPNDFVTDALQHSKVRLTWDMDDGERKEAQKRAFRGGRKDIDENDLRAYLGSDSSSEDEDEARLRDPASSVVVVDATNDNVPSAADGSQPATKSNSIKPTQGEPKLSKKEHERQKMRSLLGLSAESAPRSKKANDAEAEGDMQVTFSAALTSNGDKKSVFENTPEEAKETTIEKYVRKEKERKAKRKEKIKAARDDGAQPSNIDISEVPEKEEMSDLGFDDPFFAGKADKDASKSKKKKDKRDKHRFGDVHDTDDVTSDLEGPNDQINNEHLDAQADDDDDGIQHFDMRALTRASKPSLHKSGKKKRKLTQRDREALEQAQRDTFELDVKDERFRDVFERPEYAIDPSHPRFVNTEGMGRMLEEGRKVRRKGIDDVVGEEGRRGGTNGEKRRRDEGAQGGDGELDTLVKRVKAKTKKG